MGERTNSNRKPAQDGATEDRENTTKYSEQNGNPEKRSVAVQGRRHSVHLLRIAWGLDMSRGREKGYHKRTIWQ